MCSHNMLHLDSVFVLMIKITFFDGKKIPGQDVLHFGSLLMFMYETVAS